MFFFFNLFTAIANIIKEFSNSCLKKKTSRDSRTPCISAQIDASKQGVFVRVICAPHLPGLSLKSTSWRPADRLPWKWALRAELASPLSTINNLRVPRLIFAIPTDERRTKRRKTNIYIFFIYIFRREMLIKYNRYFVSVPEKFLRIYFLIRSILYIAVVKI